MSKFKVGDRVEVTFMGFKTKHVGYIERESIQIPYDWEVRLGDDNHNSFVFESEMTLVDEPEIVKEVVHVTKPDGGPSDYYDLQNGGTLNDELEHKGEHQWKGDTFHLANVVKAAWRWGIKDGTTKEYDARKFIYSGCRLLMKYAGVKEVRNTLQRMLDDPQFQEKDQ